LSDHASPHLPPGDSPDVLDVEVLDVQPSTLAAVGELFTTPVDEGIVAGDKRILDVLDQLAPTHPDRMGMRVTLEHVGATGVARAVPGDWTDDLPTQTRVSELVGLGFAPAGKYRVLLMRGRRTMPHIRYEVHPPIMAHDAAAPGAAPGGAGSVAQLREMAGVLRELKDPVGSSLAPQDGAGMAGELDAIAGDVEALTDRIESLEAGFQQLSDLARQLVSAPAGADDEDSAGGLLGGLNVKDLLDTAKAFGLVGGPAAQPVTAAATA